MGILPKSNLMEILSSEITCPLGQLVLASYSKDRIEGLTAKVFDGSKSTDKEIIEEAKKLDKPLIGISITAGNNENSFPLAKKLHENGLDVIVGGPEVTMVGEKIIEGRPYIKRAIIGAGEQILINLLKGEESTQISGRLLDFKGINVDYKLLNNLNDYNGLTYLWANDCQNSKNRCYFCGRISLGIGFRDPKKVWEEIKFLHKLGIKNFYNCADTVATSVSEFEKFVRTRPRGLEDAVHKVFINANQTNETTTPLLRKLNSLVHIGVENIALYDKVGKNNSLAGDNDQALMQLQKENIPVVLSFVIGMPGENQETLKINREYIKKIAERYGIIKQLEISPLMITHGSRAYHDLMSIPIISNKYKSKQLPYDTIEMSTDYFRHFCNIDRKTALYWIKELGRDLKNINPNVEIDSKGISLEDYQLIKK